MIAKMYFSGRALFSGRSLLTAAAATALAMAPGLPVVSTAVGGVPELVHGDEAPSS